jgi:lipopolysaccharide transport system ATP-binding protein
MSKLAIKAENISKQYRLGEVGTGTLSHDLNRMWHKLRGKEDPYLKIGETNNRSTKGESDYVWSLQDINFEIEQGDAVGIIGRNGAGKSTLLKILSKVTKPTTGNIKVNGRIASLLEVGTGFNPEMTGRENIYLNGAILGMRRAEITRKLDEIIDFSGVERYIDTPVKRYSSGMYVRLAFAVAANLESEILIVDEVLAVGDSEFQKKCLGKMGEVSKGEGRTILFVSHNMAAIKQLCSSAVLLKEGRINCKGNITSIISQYSKISNQDLNRFWSGSKISRDKNIELTNITIEDSNDKNIESFSNEMDLMISLSYKILKSTKINYRIILSICTIDETILFSQGVFINNIEPGFYNKKIIIPKRFLNKGIYSIKLRLDIPKQEVLIKESTIITFSIDEILYHNYGIITNNEPKGIFHFNLTELTSTI